MIPTRDEARVCRRQLLKELSVLPAVALLSAACAAVSPVTPVPTSTREASPTRVPAEVPGTPTPPPTLSGAPTPRATVTTTPEQKSMTLSGSPSSDDHAALASWLPGRFDPSTGVMPFSFTYGGQSSRSILSTWTFSQGHTNLAAQRKQSTYRYEDPASRLLVQAEVIEYADFPAVEWVLRFKNQGSTDTPLLADIQALDTAFAAKSSQNDLGQTDGVILHYSNGSTADAADFQQIDSRLDPGQSLALAPNGGRSSDGVLPFFNLEQADGSGVILGIGWSGQWKASFHRARGSEVQVTAGMERTHLKLHPGEQIRTPRTLLLFWEGERLHGQNVLRRFILAHATPTKNGKRIVGPIWASDTGDLGFNGVTAENQIQSVTAVAQHHLPLDYWQMDAGWFEKGWPIVGTWEPDPKRFPHGLKPVSDAVHQAGFGYILWFEPERVMPDTWLRDNHPEWLLAPANLPGDLQYQENWRLLNLGNPEALAWAKQKFSGMIRDYGVDVYRHDFNMHPLYYWRSSEEPDRQGMNEVRYIEGFYDYWDYLLKEHSGLWIDNSASGGRRFDLETVRRSYPLFRSDYLWYPESEEQFTWGLSNWLPISGSGVHQTVDPYAFRSGMDTSVALAFDFTKSNIPFDALDALLAEYKAVREYFYGDYYPIVNGVTSSSLVVAYQFHREDLGAGMVLAFRSEGADKDSLLVHLEGLDPIKNYQITNVDSRAQETGTGQDLMHTGVNVPLDPAPSSSLLTYRHSP